MFSGALFPDASFFASLALAEHFFSPAFSFAPSTLSVQAELPQTIVAIVALPFLLSLTLPFLTFALAAFAGGGGGGGMAGCQPGSNPLSMTFVKPLPSAPTVKTP